MLRRPSTLSQNVRTTLVYPEPRLCYQYYIAFTPACQVFSPESAQLSAISRMNEDIVQSQRGFVEQVREVLAHLYEYPYLQTHPLANALKSGSYLPTQERMLFLRTAILEAVEEMNPGTDVPLRSLRARAYNVLNLHYVEGLTVQEVSAELAISDRQVYRELRKAEGILPTLLWARRRTALPQVRVDFAYRTIRHDASEHLYRLEVLVINQGFRPVKDLKLEFVFPDLDSIPLRWTVLGSEGESEGRLVEVGSEDDAVLVRREKFMIHVTYRSSDVLFPQDKLGLGEVIGLRYRVNRSVYANIAHLPPLHWVSYADNMSPKQGEVSIAELNNYWSAPTTGWMCPESCGLLGSLVVVAPRRPHSRLPVLLGDWRC